MSDDGALVLALFVFEHFHPGSERIHGAFLLGFAAESGRGRKKAAGKGNEAASCTKDGPDGFGLVCRFVVRSVHRTESR
jgi:hypothetical protein